MRRLRLMWVMSAAFVVVVGISMVALGWYSISAARGSYLDHMEQELESRARLVEAQLTRSDVAAGSDEARELVMSLGRVSDTRFTLIDAQGVVLADSVGDPRTMNDHSTRPEVREALEGRVGADTRESPTLGVEELYVAVPWRVGGRIEGVTRAAVPLTSVSDALDSLYLRLAIGAVLTAALVGGLGIYISGRISRRLRTMGQGAERFAAGDFSYKIPPSRTVEFDAVGASLNQMATRLDRTIRTITEQRNERDAVLTSMVEGVLAIDLDERVITMNRAAGVLLTVDSDAAQGRTIQEVVRNRELQRLVAMALAEQEPVEGEVRLRTRDGDMCLQVNCTGLRDASNIPLGAIAVFNDVTRLKSLEQMRSDFVANVSHEIKTPVTSIKGFAETLLEGALDEPEEARRFVGIIVSQSDRLNSIVEDLLALSSAEQLGDRALELQESSVVDVLQVAVDVCHVKADERGVGIELDAPSSLYASIIPPLLEQAVVNLIDNAVKYSAEGERVTVSLREVDDEIVIAVQDSGCGIAREHLPHLFERFYRVDKARSRAMGGTGLGLSIVKHIVKAHGGRVGVESSLGGGSTFTIMLPR